MARNRPAPMGYERLAQADQFTDDSDNEIDPLAQSFTSLQPASAPRYAPITQPHPHSGMTSPRGLGRTGSTASGQFRPPGSSCNYQPRNRRMRSNSGVDLKAINARLERWADEIASKFKRGKNKKHGEDDDDERLEIHHTVFQAPEGVRPVTKEVWVVPETGCMTKAEFDTVVDSVRVAIEQGVHPRMISQGSSGSYFARDTEGKVVGVFKPKDEEPYAAGNPKWNKWIHRNLFPCFFGRACLIPNLSYVSEAAAYVLDVQLRTHLVPYTDVVWLSSKSFHYPFWDRYNYSRKKKALPAKPGSFQVFLRGFKDANVFLRDHPWPDQYLSGFRTHDQHRKRKRQWAENCRLSSSAVDRVGEDDRDSEYGQDSPATFTPGPGNFLWTEGLKQAFREELEKLVILDYMMRNTDRGLDNWMIKVDWETEEVSIVSEPLQMDLENENANGSDLNGQLGPRTVGSSQLEPARTRVSYPSYRSQKPMDASTPPGGFKEPKISIGAIDNSLSWPWKHPDAWRSFPFGWLFLPVDLIGRPFSQKTRDHFLPLLTSTYWWSETQLALRKVFQIDPDFQERMFARQIAVMKGQAWNVVETLKTADHGPLELTRRAKVCVWDDLVDVPVAVPMRVPSAEMRRAAESDLAKGTHEEMDIGAVNTSRAHGSTQMPNPGRFDLTGSSDKVPPVEGTSTSSPTLLHGMGPPPPFHARNASTPTSPRASRPAMNRTSLSSTGPRRSTNVNSSEQQRTRNHQRRFSFTVAAGRRGGRLMRHPLEDNDEGDDDEQDGDLGYAAAEGMEGNQRMVIVERLETVKARNPVFTWC